MSLGFRVKAIWFTVCEFAFLRLGPAHVIFSNFYRARCGSWHRKVCTTLTPIPIAPNSGDALWHVSVSVLPVFARRNAAQRYLLYFLITITVIQLLFV